MNIKFRGGLLGLKRLHGFLEVTAAQVRNRSRFGINKYNGGFVAFGSDPKGDELKFNLFPVSQMCDKKNSVLFTETKCLILSPSFKLLDESIVVLRAPRKDDVYILDLKNIVPSGDQHEIQLDLSPRPLPTIPIPDSIPEGFGGNHGGQSSNDRSLSGNEDGC
ncbi:hypothetical protein Tco_0703075 [Tanacetum coccineum]|uniref:Uncharacterized protein n=1 Tax=Tanacetum coccineum TaxID=301880 RepID=A0ABQ4XXT4_9ASTR